MKTISIKNLTNTKLQISYTSGVFSIDIWCTQKQLLRHFNKTSDQVCISDIPQLQSLFKCMERLTYINDINNWKSSDGLLEFTERDGVISCTEISTGSIIELKAHQIKDKWKFGINDFNKIKNASNNKKELMLSLLQRGREKASIKDEDLTN